MVAAIERATLEGKGWDLELGLNRLDGQQIWVRVVGDVEFADGKPARVVGATQDITARVTEQRALEEANLRAAMAAASGGIGLFEVDLLSGRVKYDAIMYQLYGLTPDCDVEGDVEFWMRRLHPDDRPALELALQDAIAKIRPYDLDFRIVWDDGSIHHIKATGRVTCDLNGIPIRIAGTNMDITAAKLAEQALRDQASLLDLSHDGIMVRDFDGTIRFWNRGAEEMYGVAAEEACGKLAQDLLQTVSPQPLAEIDADLLQHGRWEGDLQHTTRDGRHIVVSSRWVLQLIGDGTTSRVMEINEDITERSLQEKALRKSEAFLEQTGKLAGVGGWEFDLATKEVSWTKETYRILGADSSYRPTLEDAFNLYSPESLSLLDAAFEKAAGDGQGFDLELALVRFDGQPIEVRVVASVQLAHGKPVRFLGAFHDITERKRAEATLRQTEQMQRLILDHSPIAALLSTGEDQVFVYENPRFIEWFGYPMDKVPKVADWWPLAYPDPEYREWVSSEWNRRVAKSVENEDEIEPMEVTITCADGTQKYIRVAAKRIREFNFVTFIDLTERKKVEVALQKSEDAYRKLAELVPQLVWKCTPDGLNIYFNRQWVDYTGLTLEESYGTGWNTPFHPDDKAPAWKAWDHSVQTGENYRIDCRLRAADGSYRWFLIKGIPLRDESGAIIEWFGTCTDVDDLKRAEEELVRKTQELMRSNQELDQFAYAASHDLKAPLRVIFNASKWLEEDLEKYLTPSTREDMDLLRRRVLRMEKLLDDLLEYSRIGRTKSEQRVEILSADELMDNILGLISLPEGFTVSLSPKLAGIQVKRMPLQQVLINLIGNALKHHDKKTGCVEVSIEDLGSQLEFAVRDDGPGIPPEFHEQIFKMFQTLKPRDQVEGSGMGLAMVRKYIEFAGGEIAVESGVGRGSTFRFSWPKQPMEEEPS
jgi:PAS domain S-box-containing protein